VGATEVFERTRAVTIVAWHVYSGYLVTRAPGEATGLADTTAPIFFVNVLYAACAVAMLLSHRRAAATITEKRRIRVLVVGTVAGAILAAAVFTISVISVPLLMERDVDFLSAIFTSIQAVLRNPKPMLLWAWLVALLTACGLVTLYLGLIVTFPLVGHATWHAYRETVGQ